MRAYYSNKIPGSNEVQHWLAMDQLMPLPAARKQGLNPVASA